MEEGSEMKMAKKTALYGMLIALAMILSFVETLIPISLGVPGIKLGLANLVTIVCLYTMGPAGAFAVLIVRIFLVGITFGNLFSLIYSLAGGMLSFFCMILAKRTGLLGMTGVSIIGGVTHNIGQILAAVFVVRTIGLFWYLPVLMLAGMVTGALIGVLASLIISRLKPVITEIKEDR